MKKEIIKCQQTVKDLIDNIQVKNGKGEDLTFDQGLEEAINMILRQSQAGG